MPPGLHKCSTIGSQPSTGPAPGAEDEAADCHAEQWPAHVDANKRPRIRLESGENRNGRVLHEYKGEPAGEREFKTAPDACRVGPRNKRCECVIDCNRSEEREHISADVVRVFDVSHCSGVQIEPLLAEDGVPAPADQKINDDEDPNGEMIDLCVH